MSNRESALISACVIALLSCACSASGTATTMATGGDSSGSTGGASAFGGQGSATGGAAVVAVACNSDLQSTGCTPGQMTQTGTLAGRYGTLNTTIGDKQYFMQVNEWGATATQSMSYGGSFFFKMTQQQASLSGSGAPAGYPSMFIGANSNHTTANSGLPKQVSALSQVLTTWNWADNGNLADATNNIFNAAYDVWFSTSSAGDPTLSAPSGGYLMVWYHAQGCQPIGALLDAGHTIEGMPGCWDVWGGMNGSKPVISYKHQGPLLSFGYDLNVFIKDALANYPTYMKSNWYLTNIFTGFEIWKGGVNLETTSFCADVN